MKKQPPTTKLTYLTAKKPNGYSAALFEAVVDLSCERCGKTIPAGSLIMKCEAAKPIAITSKGTFVQDRKKYPNCRECSPFEGISHVSQIDRKPFRYRKGEQVEIEGRPCQIDFCLTDNGRRYYSYHFVDIPDEQKKPELLDIDANELEGM